MKKLITISELAIMLNKSKITIWRYTKNEVLPQPIRVNGQTLGWQEDAIINWLNEQS